VLSFGEKQASLELVEKAKIKRRRRRHHNHHSYLLWQAKNKGEAINHAVAFGRIAFSVPRAVLPGIQEAVQKSNYTILTPLVSLDTPGKATVEVTILADPDGYEICFVGDEAFRELSQVDTNAAKLLDVRFSFSICGSGTEGIDRHSILTPPHISSSFLLNKTQEAIDKDKSDEWFAKRAARLAAAATTAAK